MSTTSALRARTTSSSYSRLVSSTARSPTWTVRRARSTVSGADGDRLAEGGLGRGRRPRAPAQQGAQPRHELGERERLDHVVVGAGLEPDDAVVDGVARREHAHGHVVVHRPQRRHDGHPVHAGQPEVEDDGVGDALVHRPQRARPVLRGAHGEPREPQAALERRPHVGVVVDHQQVGVRLAHGRGWCHRVREGPRGGGRAVGTAQRSAHGRAARSTRWLTSARRAASSGSWAVAGPEGCSRSRSISLRASGESVSGAPPVAPGRSRAVQGAWPLAGAGGGRGRRRGGRRRRLRRARRRTRRAGTARPRPVRRAPAGGGSPSPRSPHDTGGRSRGGRLVIHPGHRP